MKRLIFILLLLIFYSGFAQDNSQLSVVYLHDGSMIKGQVVEDHSLEQVKVIIIGGTELLIPLRSVKSIVRSKENIALLRSGRYVQTKGFYQMISGGTLTGWEDEDRDLIEWGASLFHYNAGYQFNRFLSVGGGFGIDIYDKEYLPVYADFRGYVIDAAVSPYYAFQAGYAFPTDLFNTFSDNTAQKGGAMLHPSVGLRFASFRKAKFIMEAGYKFQYHRRHNEWNNSTDKIIYKRLALKLGVLF